MLKGKFLIIKKNPILLSILINQCAVLVDHNFNYSSDHAVFSKSLHFITSQNQGKRSQTDETYTLAQHLFSLYFDMYPLFFVDILLKSN